METAFHGGMDPGLFLSHDQGDIAVDKLIASVDPMKITPAEKVKILSRNARRLLKLS